MTPLQRAPDFEPIPRNFAESMRDLDWCPPDKYHFGAFNIPLEHAVHTMMWGAPRRGKSVAAKLLGATALQSIKHGYTSTALFLDLKKEYFLWLCSVLPRNSIRYLQPFDPDGARWLPFEDFGDSIESMEALGRMLAPSNPEATNPFFDQATANILAGLCVGVGVTQGTSATLEDLTRYLQDESTMRDGLKLAPELNRSRLATYFGAKPNRDVLSTLANRLVDLRAAAAMMQRASQCFSVKGYLASEYALVVGHSHAYAEATAALTRCVVSSASRSILDLPDRYYPNHWLFLDEIPHFGKVDLTSLLALAPAKGAVCCLTTQDSALMKHVYGEALYQAISGTIQQKLWFRLSCPTTAEEASLHFGDVEKVRFSRSISHSLGSDGQPQETFGISEQFERVRAVPPHVFMNLPPLSPTNPRLYFLAVSPTLGNYADSIEFTFIVRAVPRPVQQQLPEQKPPKLLPPHGPLDDDLDDDGGSASFVPARPRRPTPAPLRANAVRVVEDDEDLPYWKHDATNLADEE